MSVHLTVDRNSFYVIAREKKKRQKLLLVTLSCRYLCMLVSATCQSRVFLFHIGPSRPDVPPHHPSSLVPRRGLPFIGPNTRSNGHKGRPGDTTSARAIRLPCVLRAKIYHHYGPACKTYSVSISIRCVRFWPLEQST